MKNLFINVTTFGQSFGATFDFAIEGNLGDKRITPLELCEMQAPVYTKELTADKITEYIAKGKKVANLEKATETENKRVNALYAFVRELNMVANMEDDGQAIIAYLPTELLKEIETGRIKFYLADDAPETSYYSEFELELWRQALPLIQALYCRIVFKDIQACKNNVSGNDIQTLRVNIYKSIYNKMLIAFREMKAQRVATGNTQQQAFDPQDQAF